MDKKQVRRILVFYENSVGCVLLSEAKDFVDEFMNAHWEKLREQLNKD